MSLASAMIFAFFPFAINEARQKDLQWLWGDRSSAKFEAYLIKEWIPEMKLPFRRCEFWQLRICEGLHIV